MKPEDLARIQAAAKAAAAALPPLTDEQCDALAALLARCPIRRHPPEQQH